MSMFNKHYYIILGRREIRELPVKCDNMERGCQWVGTVGTPEEHYDRCQYTVISCKYTSIGCDVKLIRKDIKDHEQDYKAHLNKALDSMIKLEDTVIELKDIASEFEKKLTLLQNKEEPMVFKVTEFQKKKGKNAIACSPYFHTSPNGYNMNILMFANGYEEGEGSHVSVFACIVKGQYDAELNWPFVGKVTFELLNQLEDKKHHSSALIFTPVEKGTGGYSEYIHHSRLSRDTASNTQYLKDDTLYFRISVVEVSDHKPWLECTI